MAIKRPNTAELEEKLFHVEGELEEKRKKVATLTAMVSTSNARLVATEKDLHDAHKRTTLWVIAFAVTLVGLVLCLAGVI